MHKLLHPAYYRLKLREYGGPILIDLSGIPAVVLGGAFMGLSAIISLALLLGRVILMGYVTGDVVFSTYYPPPLLIAVDVGNALEKACSVIGTIFSGLDILLLYLISVNAQCRSPKAHSCTVLSIAFSFIGLAMMIILYPSTSRAATYHLDYTQNCTVSFCGYANNSFPMDPGTYPSGVNVTDTDYIDTSRAFDACFGFQAIQIIFAVSFYLVLFWIPGSWRLPRHSKPYFKNDPDPEAQEGDGTFNSGGMDNGESENGESDKDTVVCVAERIWLEQEKLRLQKKSEKKAKAAPEGHSENSPSDKADATAEASLPEQSESATPEPPSEDQSETTNTMIPSRKVQVATKRYNAQFKGVSGSLSGYYTLMALVAIHIGFQVWHVKIRMVSNYTIAQFYYGEWAFIFCYIYPFFWIPSCLVMLLFHHRRWTVSAPTRLFDLTVQQLVHIYFFIPATLSAIGMVLSLIAMGRDGENQSMTVSPNVSELAYGFLYIIFAVIPLGGYIIGRTQENYKGCRRYLADRRAKQRARSEGKRTDV